MKNLSLTLIFCILFTWIAAQPCKQVIAYYPNWQWYDRNKLVQPTTIDYSKYTIINYSFFSPQPNGLIAQTDTWADENLLFGQPDWQNGGYIANTSLIDLAHNNNVKVLASIGGWTLSNNFPGIAADSSKRAVFAGECKRLIHDFGFDGIDIDWEYPGYAEHNGTPNDGPHFTALLNSIRDSLDAYELITGDDYLLTSCFSADPVKMMFIGWSAIDSVLDYFNLMTYDFFGAWDSISNHNSPLYAPAQGNPAFNINAAFNTVNQVYGIDASKINIGLAFYGRSVTGCTSLHGPTNNTPDYTTFWEDDGSPLYYNLLNKMNLFTSYWDSIAMVPYLLGNNMSTFVSYDNKQSIAQKAQYVVNNNAAGVIIWELTGDYLETVPNSGIIASTPLADTLNLVLCGIATDIPEFESSGVLSVRAWPNPVSTNSALNILVNGEKMSEFQITISTIQGRRIKTISKKISNSGKGQYSFSFHQKGIYLVKVSTGTEIQTLKIIVW